MFVLFGSLWKSSLVSVVCVLAFCSDGKAMVCEGYATLVLFITINSLLLLF